MSKTLIYNNERLVNGALMCCGVLFENTTGTSIIKLAEAVAQWPKAELVIRPNGYTILDGEWVPVKPLRQKRYEKSVIRAKKEADLAKQRLAARRKRKHESRIKKFEREAQALGYIVTMPNPAETEPVTAAPAPAEPVTATN